VRRGADAVRYGLQGLIIIITTMGCHVALHSLQRVQYCLVLASGLCAHAVMHLYAWRMLRQTQCIPVAVLIILMAEP
jgi:Flp pilus assembly protein TadB